MNFTPFHVVLFVVGYIVSCLFFPVLVFDKPQLIGVISLMSIAYLVVVGSATMMANMGAREKAVRYEARKKLLESEAELIVLLQQSVTHLRAIITVCESEYPAEDLAGFRVPEIKDFAAKADQILLEKIIGKHNETSRPDCT
jgi:hypothetical protein